VEGGCGTVFKITPSGALTTLHSFCTLPNCTDGALPTAALIQANNGDFYGTTVYGGAHNAGTIFKITSSGELTTLYNFCTLPKCADGSLPSSALILMGGDFYGTTGIGGTSNGPCTIAEGCGTVFKLTPGGKLTTLYSFCSQSNCSDGALPDTAVIQAPNGDLYGTTTQSGAVLAPGGTVFKITPAGQLTTLYTFCSQLYCPDGSVPNSLIRTANGDMYGTTYDGGTYYYGPGGTFFRISPGGTLTTLYNFCSIPGCPDGNNPAALLQAANGELFGEAGGGGATGAGTIFKITAGGTLTTLFNFCAQPNGECTDGGAPNALIQATNGDLYGTTVAGGTRYNGGVIFSLNLGLGPFVALQTTSGEVGAKVTILGTDLAGATSVTFNGTSATFTVNSTGSAITSTVPQGATTGTVQVVTPNGILNSNVVYRVE
jgi:uncharacterized repeat protein (TIGR03803 family)